MCNATGSQSPIDLGGTSLGLLLLDNSIGITTLEQSLILQNLPTDVLDREMALAKTLPCQVAAPVRDLEYDARTARFVQLALMAGREAAQNANLLSWLGHDNNDGNNDDDDNTIRQRRERVGTCIGSGMSSVREVATRRKRRTVGIPSVDCHLTLFPRSCRIPQPVG